MGIIMRYDKPPLSIDQQIDLLISRGMIVEDRFLAARYLTHINYYRLRAYWLVYEDPEKSAVHRFKKGTHFSQVLSLYIFDRKFRLLVLEAIERVEISFRTRFAYVLGTRYGSHAHLEEGLFKSSYTHNQCLENLREEFNRSRETFIEHYKTKYRQPDLPPIWAACEIMTLGQLSMWFKNLKRRSDRQEIASVFKIDASILGSFMHHLTHVRNIVAHHGRLWNRRLTITMTIPIRPQEITSDFHTESNRNIYNTLVMLGYLLRSMSHGTTWIERMKRLIEESEVADPSMMGFPKKWQALPTWSQRS
ncbi:MAG: Abi family protein [Syntrophales bacterium]|nr:Abi family protein [Syntrophales bacterium]